MLFAFFRLCLALLSSGSLAFATAGESADSAIWESEVAQLEAHFQKQPKVLGGVVFAGSSSIRLWDLTQSFPGLSLANCGFGGSNISDSTSFAPRLLFPLQPRLIVFYAGDNDSANGHTAAQIASDFVAFTVTIHAALPACRVLYLSIKPSIARQKLLPVQREANTLIQQHCTTQPSLLQYLDLATPLLTSEGNLRPELYLADGLHLSPAGYEIWSRRLRPYLEPLVPR